MSLSGKVALVTGGSRGIGKAICLALASDGANVIVNYARHSKEADETVLSLQQLGVKAKKIRANLGDPEKIKEMFREIQREFGSLDILVNNAASGVQRQATELEIKHWDWTLDINARAAWLCAIASTKLMAPGSRIVNITSLGSYKVIPNYVSVGVSKAALEALTRYLAVELSSQGIIVNAVSGGLVDTDALRSFENSKDLIEDSVSRTPAGRMIKATDISDVVLFLCSEQSSMIRGQVIVVDGGISLLAL
ncbi:MAG: enoyl-[acyl-carrier-protein] reductase FabL [SAR202 cluster bacterium]|nr:enoyl-[acyl-carrier-protein] reductase FabL [SAR202 cluster bacterium]|tara:strand:+ start:11812 stop:12564 length:753 start_codon:yes stop_codon:yes gene_type:complete